MTYEQAKKNRLHKVLRRESRILIEEALVPDPVVVESNEEAFLEMEWEWSRRPFTGYRLVVETQVRENYGAHSWDGHGKVPQHWKCKGGNEYHLGDIVTDPCPKLLRERVAEWQHRIEQSNDWYKEFIISAVWIGTDDMTHEEWSQRDRESWGYDTLDGRIFLTKEREAEKAWREYEELYSVEAHNLI